MRIGCPGRPQIKAASPQPRPRRGARRRCQPLQFVGDGRTIKPDHHHPAGGVVDCLRPFGRRAEHKAGRTKPGCLALDAAGIGDDGRGVKLECQ